MLVWLECSGQRSYRLTDGIDSKARRGVEDVRATLEQQEHQGLGDGRVDGVATQGQVL